MIQSNQEFRLNDTMDVNVIHVSIPTGGRGSKQREVNSEKHLKKNNDNNPQYKSVVDYRQPMQTHLAQELHQNAGIPLGPYGIDQAKQFQLYMMEYQYCVKRVCK